MRPSTITGAGMAKLEKLEKEDRIDEELEEEQAELETKSAKRKK